jgi:hypothetical protein
VSAASRAKAVDRSDEAEAAGCDGYDIGYCAPSESRLVWVQSARKCAA